MQRREAHTNLLLRAVREYREQWPSHTGSLVHISLQASNTEANMQGDWTVQVLPQ